MKTTLLSYVRYNLWAHTRVVDFIKELPEAQLHREIASSFSSVHKTLFHIYGAQSLWISRLHGNSPTVFPPPDSMSPSEAMQALLDTSKQLISFVEHSSCNWGGNPFSWVTGFLLHLACNMGSYHRGQIVTLLRHLGYDKLFDSDYIIFTRSAIPA